MGEIDYILENLPKAFSQPNYTEDDQGMLTQLVLNVELPGTQIDAWCRIFQTMGGPAAARNVVGIPVLNDLAGTFPSVLHYNGRSGGREEMWRAING